MARVPVLDAVKVPEKKTYFQSEYALSKVVGNMEVGKEICVVPIGLEGGVYRTHVHKLRAKGEHKGFKGWFDTNIVCKSVNELTGEKEEECLCCQLAKSEKEKHPDKEEASKRLIANASTLVHLPVMVLSAKDSDKLGGKQPVELLQADAVLFSYLELAGSTFESEIVGRLRTKLEEDGLINYEMTEEEANAVVSKFLCNVIIKIKCVQSKKGFKYGREYSFAPFYNKQIGAKSGQREQIIHYRKNKDLMNQVSSFLTLFDSKQEELVTNWTDEELKAYVVDSVAREENVQHAIKVDEATRQAPPKTEQVISEIEESPVEEPSMEVESDFEFDFDAPSIASEPVAEEPAIEISDEDTSFDLDTDESFFDDIAGID